MSTNNPQSPRDFESARDARSSGDVGTAGEVATGDRRDEVHFEPARDPDQLVVASHLVRPAGPLPPQVTAGAPAAERDAPPVEDVRIAPEGASVWDARPVDGAR